MPKKKRSKAQQLLKQQVLHNQLSQSQGQETFETKTKEQLSSQTREAKPFLPGNQAVGLRRTALSFVIIGIIFGAIVVVNNRSSFLATLGENLYRSLRLDR